MEENLSIVDMNDDQTPLELIYAANANKMSADDLALAIIGMSTMLKIAGRTVGIDFEDVHVQAVEQGSVKTLFVFVKRVRGRRELTPLGTSVVAGLIVLSVQLIAEYGIPALKSPDAETMREVDRQVLELCANADYRRSVGYIAQPVNEDNQKVTIKAGDVSCEITRDTRQDYIEDDEQSILPELINGSTVKLPGILTRMSLEKNDLGFQYRGRKLSITTADPEKRVATEFHQFLATPSVIVTGIVVRKSDYDAPKLKVLRMEVYKPEQMKLLDGEASTAGPITVNKWEVISDKSKDGSIQANPKQAPQN